MPAYNVEKYIEKAIQSIIDQSYTNLELLVVNDGSPDRSAEIARTYVKKDKRVVVLDKENGGLSDARNYGIEHASGRFVFFIDSDDWVEPAFLSTAVALMISEQVKVVVFGYYQDNLDLNDNLEKSIKINTPTKKYERTKNNLSIDTKILGILGYAWNKVFDLNHLKEKNMRFTKGVSLVEDILFNAPFYESIDEIYISENSYYHYNNRQIPTLIKKFHENAFELYEKKVHAINKFLTEWKMISTEKDRVLSLSLTDGIRYSIDNMIRFNNNLSLKEQFIYIKTILSHPLTEKYSPHYFSESVSGQIYRWLVITKQSLLLLIFLKLRKKLHAF